MLNKQINDKPGWSPHNFFCITRGRVYGHHTVWQGGRCCVADDWMAERLRVCVLAGCVVPVCPCACVQCRCGFNGSSDIWVRDILNLGVR